MFAYTWKLHRVWKYKVKLNGWTLIFNDNYSVKMADYTKKLFALIGLFIEGQLLHLVSTTLIKNIYNFRDNFSAHDKI